MQGGLVRRVVNGPCGFPTPLLSNKIKFALTGGAALMYKLIQSAKLDLCLKGLCRCYFRKAGYCPHFSSINCFKSGSLRMGHVLELSLIDKSRLKYWPHQKSDHFDAGASRLL